MKKDEIKVGGLYRAKVSDSLTTVRVEEVVGRDGVRIFRGEGAGFATIRGGTSYRCTNLKTGKEVRIKSAAKFRSEVKSIPAV